MKIDKFYLVSFSILVIYAIVLFFYYEKSQENAIEQAKVATQEFLRNKKATKEFFYNDQKKSIKSINKNTSSIKFLPELYSCTYAADTINNYYNGLRAKDNLPEMKVSFVSSDAKNYENMAVEEEKELLKKFNKGILTSYNKIIKKRDNKYLYFASPTEKLKKSCLECHGKPKDAPTSLIRKYGIKHGFNNKEGDIRAFIKVIVPLEPYFKDARSLFALISISTFLILISIFILIRLFVIKSKKDSKKFQTIIDNLDELIIIKSNDEIHSINKSFMKFFNVQNLENFKKQNISINNYTIEFNESFDIDLKTIDNKLIDKLIDKLKNTEKIKRVVKVTTHNGDIHTLTIRIDRLENEKNLYVIVLSDITKIQQRSEIFEKRANIDSLTGAFTRGRFDQLFHSEFARSVRYFNPLTLLFIDIDNFKITNDTYGHDVGDDVLKKFAELISLNSREFDVFARWGGEEFILMLPQTHINDGYKLAEKIRLIIASNEFEQVGTITCSIGLSMLNKGDSHESIIKRADNALYKAKYSGRNRTIIEI